MTPFLFILVISVLFPTQLLANDKILEELAKSPKWQALYFYHKGTFAINDPNFYIQKNKKPDLYKEILLASNILKKQDSEKYCLYPARLSWLNQKVKIIENINFNQCQELSRFRTKAPVDKIFLVFASENVSIPSSMMGHTYFEFHGTSENRLKKHSISFYTDIDTINIAKLILDSFIFGKKGYYALGPSRKLEKQYLQVENRNLWKYEIKLTQKERELLHLYFFELKNIRMDYYFHTFNCATLLKKLLAIINPDILNDNISWVTPLGLVRSINKIKIVKSTIFVPSNRWLIKALYQDHKFSSKEIEEIKNYKVKANDDPYYNNLLASYMEYQQANNQINNDFYNKQIISLRENEKHKSSEIDLSEFKRPALSKSNTHFALETRLNKSGRPDYFFRYLPTSHLLMNDTQQYLNETELKISDLSLSLKNKKIRLNSLIIYSSQTHQIHDPFTGGLSAGFSFGYDETLQRSLSRDEQLYVYGNIGKTFRFHLDIDFYSLIQTRLTNDQDFIRPGLKIGFILRSYQSLKFHLGWDSSLLFNKQDEMIHTLFLEGGYRASSSTGIHFRLTQDQIKSNKEKSILIGLELFQ